MGRGESVKQEQIGTDLVGDDVVNRVRVAEFTCDAVVGAPRRLDRVKSGLRVGVVRG